MNTYLLITNLHKAELTMKISASSEEEALASFEAELIKTGLRAYIPQDLKQAVKIILQPEAKIEKYS